MTLTSFVRKNAFRNKRRSILTVLSIGFSLLLLTFLIVSPAILLLRRPRGRAAAVDAH